MNTKLISYIKLFLVIIMWGGVYHSAKYLVSNTDIFTVAFIRFTSASLILLFIYFKKNKKIVKRPKEYWLMLFGIGFVGIFLYTTLFFAAESLISANQVAVLYALTPCLTVLLCRFFLKQKLTLFAYLGILIALFGAVIVVTLSDNTITFDISLGQIFALLAAICMAFFSIMSKKAALMKIDSLSTTTFGALFGSVLLFFSFILFGEPIVNLLDKSLMFWLAMFYTSFCGTVLCYKWYSDALNDIGVGQTAVFLNAIPLAAIIVGTFFGESIKLSVLFAGIVIIAGVLITNYAITKR